ncbi:uncharacterized protein [Amphiura filiformis]|uniref:uncharacterized protein n=1 Tax=Amphiura filiformis TaxID=82378 RepID=UPI003B20EB70
MVLNFQSVNNKIAELAICLDNHKPDVLIGTESWLSPGVSNSEIFPPDYSVIRKDRPPNEKGQSHGGIFIAHHSAAGMSDHDGIPLINIDTKPKINKSKPRKVFQFFKADWSNIKQDLTEISSDFSDIIPDLVSADELWVDFKNRIQETMEKNIPSRVVSSGKKIPWVDYEVKRALRHKQNAYNKARATDSSEHWEIFKSLRKHVNRLTRSKYRRYIRDVCAESNKKFWSLIKSLKNDSFGIPTLKSVVGCNITENKEKAEVMNDQFQSVFTQENMNNVPSITSTQFPPMPDIDISTDGVTKLLLDLDMTKATGPDEIPARILKMGAAEIAPALTTIFRRSLETGILPDDWRCANISPIFKKGDRTTPANYRPVSLTSISCKVMEHVIFSSIMRHLNQFNILTDQQHGFRQNRSRESQLILTIHDFALSLDSKQQTDVIIMDFSKAFDVVPHNRLMLKLDHYTRTYPRLDLRLPNAKKAEGCHWGENSDWETNSHTYLGAEIANDLKWNKHINNIAAKGNRALGFVKRNLRSCTEDIKQLAYQSLVRPSLEYSSSVWDPYTAEKIYQLEAVQRRAIRFVKNNYDKRASVTEMLKNSNWSSLQQRRKIARLSTFQKAYQGYLSIPIRTLLRPVTRTTRRSHSKAFIEVQTTKDCYKHSFLPRTLKEWNSLPEEIVNIEDPKQFKTQVINYQ